MLRIMQTLQAPAARLSHPTLVREIDGEAHAKLCQRQN